ncbi:MAG: hypothetical protein HUJ69_06840, partial [Lachnospiraceae bacterium]|nr:hypothetical protein [Lachnospiraceae bacterium]
MLNLYIEWNLEEAPETEAPTEVNSTVEAAGTPGVDPADMETLWRTALEAALA